ncbi:MAG TPA: pyridoxamine 5'-phosphate oxidase [Cyclobacteriaceae bacterium]|nr:pyridoxamine 5'-phosphate oxidase [Cyclobacteriaceae bacterium]
MKLKIADIRKEYLRKKLSISDVHADPMEQFNQWLTEAIDADIPEPTAMCLSTVSESGVPSSRMVLLKDARDGKFFFYTNYNSRKGRDLDNNPNCSITFFWPGLERQINITGIAEKVSPETSDAYFNTRPWSSQIGAWVSPQSMPISSRIVILREFILLSARYVGRNVPRPPHWGGYAVTPSVISFWQGRPSRLHDRIQYRLENSGTWIKERIAP